VIQSGIKSEKDNQPGTELSFPEQKQAGDNHCQQKQPGKSKLMVSHIDELIQQMGGQGDTQVLTDSNIAINLSLG
jgi:hypothetical protein